MEVRYVKWGLANNFGTFIELNENLKDYPKLHDSILQHEFQHTDKLFTLHDLNHDLKNDGHEVDKILFMVKHPKTWIQFLPLYWTKSKGFVYDINLSIFWFFILGIISTGVFIGFAF